MAEKRTINIDINSNASEAEKDFKSFNKAVDETTKSAKNLDATFEEVYGDLQPLTTRMGEAEDRLYELALAGDTASKEYQELLTKVGEYRKVQIQTDLAVDGAATTMTQKLGSALNGATSGFAATQGAMALFGDENQALEESLLKVQSALAIQQGVQGLTEAYRELSIGTKIAAAGQAAFTFVTGGASTALKIFRAALISTGVGALVVGLGLLIANFDKVKKVLSNVNKGFKEGGLLTKALMIAFMPLIATVKLVQKGLQAIGVLESDEEKERKERGAEQLRRIEEERKARENAFNSRQKQFDREIALLSAEGKATFELSQTKIQASIDYQKQLIKEKELALASIEQAFKGIALAEVANEATKEQREELKALNESVLDSENQLKINVLNNNKAKTDSYKDYAASRLSIARQIEDIENGLLEDGIEKELEINRDKFRRLREDAKKNTKLTAKERAALKDLYDKQELAQQKVINKKYVDLEKEKNAKIDEVNKKANQDRIDKEDALFQLELDLMKDRQMAEIIALSQSYEAKYLLAQDNAELTKQLEAQFLIDQAAIEDQFRKEKADKEKAASDKSIAEAQAEADAKLAIQNAQIGIAEAGIGLIKELAGENKKILAAALIAENAAGVAKIIINTVAANAKAVVASPLTAGQPWVSINSIGAGIGIASSVAATAKGLSALGGGGSPDSGSVPSGGAASAAAPQFNVVGDSGINQIAQLQQQPVQAFVVSGEVTTSQALDRNRVQNATL